MYSYLCSSSDLFGIPHLSSLIVWVSCDVPSYICYSHAYPIRFHPWFPGTTPGRMLKMLSNILAEQCLTIVQSVLILIGALKKAGSGAVDGVAVKYCLDLISNKMYIWPSTCFMLILFVSFIGQRWVPDRLWSRYPFDTMQLQFTPFLFGLYYVILISVDLPLDFPLNLAIKLHIVQYLLFPLLVQYGVPLHIPFFLQLRSSIPKLP